MKLCAGKESQANVCLSAISCGFSSSRITVVYFIRKFWWLADIFFVVKENLFYFIVFSVSAYYYKPSITAILNSFIIKQNAQVTSNYICER